MSSTLVTKQPVKQTGFRKGFTTVSHNQTLELTIEKYQELQRIIYIIITVQKKAFDSVSHISTCEGPGRARIGCMKKLSRAFTATNIGRTKLESIGQSFSIRRGVRQGNPLSPILFISILENIISKLDWCMWSLL